VPIVEKNQDGILSHAEKIVAAGAELIEWRADFFTDLRDHNCLRDCLDKIRHIIDDIPLIFTIRTNNEGGEAQISDEDYRDLLIFTAETGLADIIDVELFRFNGNIHKLVADLQSRGSVVILSNHDFHSTPPKPEIIRRLSLMQQAGGDILKIAVMPNSAADVLELLCATNEFSQQSESLLVTMAMGGLGSISRITGEVFKSCLTFGTAGKSSAPGQIPIEQLKKCLDIIHDTQMFE